MTAMAEKSRKKKQIFEISSIMNREEAMELVSNGYSDMEIKKEFYDGLVKDYFSGGRLLEGVDEKSLFFKIDGFYSRIAGQVEMADKM